MHNLPAPGIEWRILNEESQRLYRAGEYDRGIVVALKALEVAEKMSGQTIRTSQPASTIWPCCTTPRETTLPQNHSTNVRLRSGKKHSDQTIQRSQSVSTILPCCTSLWETTLLLSRSINVRWQFWKKHSDRTTQSSHLASWVWQSYTVFKETTRLLSRS